MATEDKCHSCGHTPEKPKTVWLTTQQVIDQYGFDPTPFMVGEGVIKNKLVQVSTSYGWVDMRVWLADDVEWRVKQ